MCEGLFKKFLDYHYYCLFTIMLFWKLSSCH